MGLINHQRLTVRQYLPPTVAMVSRWTSLFTPRHSGFSCFASLASFTRGFGGPAPGKTWSSVKSKDYLWLWTFDAMWCPPAISWFISPSKYRYISHNPKVLELLTNLANYGAPPCGNVRGSLIFPGHFQDYLPRKICPWSLFRFHTSLKIL